MGREALVNGAGIALSAAVGVGSGEALQYVTSNHWNITNDNLEQQNLENLTKSAVINGTAGAAVAFVYSVYACLTRAKGARTACAVFGSVIGAAASVAVGVVVDTALESVGVGPWVKAAASTGAAVTFFHLNKKATEGQNACKRDAKYGYEKIGGDDSKLNVNKGH